MPEKLPFCPYKALDPEAGLGSNPTPAGRNCVPKRDMTLNAVSHEPGRCFQREKSKATERVSQGRFP